MNCLITMSGAVCLSQSLTGQMLDAGVITPAVINDKTNHLLSVCGAERTRLAARNSQTLALQCTITLY